MHVLLIHYGVAELAMGVGMEVVYYTDFTWGTYKETIFKDLF